MGRSTARSGADHRRPLVLNIKYDPRAESIPRASPLVCRLRSERTPPSVEVRAQRASRNHGHANSRPDHQETRRLERAQRASRNHGHPDSRPNHHETRRLERAQRASRNHRFAEIRPHHQETRRLRSERVPSVEERAQRASRNHGYADSRPNHQSGRPAWRTGQTRPPQVQLKHSSTESNRCLKLSVTKPRMDA